MDHGLRNEFLNSAIKIDVTFEDSSKKTKTGTGTAFFVKNSKGETSLITNRHLIDLDYKQKTAKFKDFKLSKIIATVKEINKETNLPTEDNILFLANCNEFIFSENYENDVACLKNVQAASLNGKEPYSSFSISYTNIADKKRLNEKLSICDFVAFPGFPDWYDKKNNLPILRTGTIASDPRFDYSYNGDDNGEVIAYEAFSYGGSSGSPVFAIQKGIKVGEGLSGGNFREVMLIGINAGHLPVQGIMDSHSGISFLYKSSIILELIEQ